MSRILFLVLSMVFSYSISAQNYSISSYVGDDDGHWSAAYEHDFLYPTNNLSTWYNLPFSWNFYGQPVTGYIIAHDGYITFDNTSGNSIGTNTNIPNINGPNNAIYALWDDFTTSTIISRRTYGKEPNRIHTITWSGLNYLGASNLADDITVSLKLYESCGDFEIIINQRDIDSSSIFFPMINTTIGCENSNGTIGRELAGSPNYTPTNPDLNTNLYEVHRFRWNAPITNDASLIGIKIDNHLPIGNYSLEGVVRNEGNANLSSYDINYSLNGGTTQTTTIIESDTVWTGDYKVTIKSIDYASEISWDITNANGDIVAQGSNYVNNSIYHIPICLPVGNYTFNWHDSFGDGWNGGSYSVSDNNGTFLTSGAPITGSTGSSNFTSIGSSCFWSISSNIKNSEKSFWSHPIEIEITSASDNYELKVWVSNVNGQIDEMNCNDTLIEYITGIENNSANKKVLLEKWTGTWCGLCVDGTDIVNNLIDQYGSNFIPINLHGGDIMEFPDSLRSAFGANSYPEAIIDRKDFSVNYEYETESEGRGNWAALTSSQITEFSPVNINISHTWDSISRTITASVIANYTDNSAGDARIVLMIIEDSVTGNSSNYDQANAYNNTTGHPLYGLGNTISGFPHRNVLRDYSTGGAFGVDNLIPHIVSAGGNFQYTFNYTLPNTFDENQISLVAAVVKYMKGNDAGYVGVRGQREVYNAEQIKLIKIRTELPLGIEENKNELQIFPNPTTGAVYFSENTEYTLYDIVGNLIKQGKGSTIDLSLFSKGVYILESKNNRIKVVKK